MPALGIAIFFGNQMHYVAGTLLLAQFILMWILDRPAAPRALDYVAVATWLVGIVLIALPIPKSRRQGQAPRGASFVSTQVLVDTGIYALVRHPLYLGWLLMHLVVWLFNPHWILGGLGILGAACVYRFTRQEEKLLIEKFGASYRRYMERVPGSQARPCPFLRSAGCRSIARPRQEPEQPRAWRPGDHANAQVHHDRAQGHRVTAVRVRGTDEQLLGRHCGHRRAPGPG